MLDNPNFFIFIITESVGGPATYGFFAVVCMIASIFSYHFVPETQGKNVEELSFLYRNRAITCVPLDIMSTTLDLPGSRKVSTAEQYDDIYLAYVTLGDLEVTKEEE